MKNYITIALLSLAMTSFSQSTFSWNGTYGGTGASRTFTGTPVSGITMTATFVNSESAWQDASPKWFPTGSVNTGSGCSGIPSVNQGVLLSTDWTTNTVKTINLTISFSSPVKGPIKFKLYDINDDGSGSWVDKIIISGLNSTGGSVNCSKDGTLCIETGGTVTGNNSPLLTLNAGSSSACTCYGNNGIIVGAGADCISSFNIIYKTAVIPTNYNNPKQYIVMSNYTAFIDAIVCPIPLPIELSSFKGECLGELTKLNWTTTTEINNDRFVIEASEDGIDFTKIVEVKGAGTSTSEKSYSLDVRNQETEYYRLSQINFDGTKSNVRIIHVPCFSNSLLIYPNPFTHEVRIALENIHSSSVIVNVKDINGQMIESLAFMDISVTNEFSLDLAHLAKGVYFVEVVDFTDKTLIAQNKMIKL